MTTTIELESRIPRKIRRRKATAREARSVQGTISTSHLSPLFQLLRDARALKQGTELPGVISQGHLGFCSSLVISCGGLFEKPVI